MKIAVIGAGSTYTPELLEGLIESSKTGDLDISEVCLMDIDSEKLTIVGNFSQRMATHKNVRFKVVLTRDLEVAIKGAFFVLTQIRVGGIHARHKDILLGKKYGIIGQETVGVGGFAKALRTVPAIRVICDTINKLSPEAWLINFTNPASIISQVMIDYYPDIKWVGLCNYPVNLKNSIKEILEISDIKSISIDYIGLNHLSWVTNVHVNGKDRTEDVLSKYIESFKLSNIPSKSFNPTMVSSLGMLLNPYLLYYYNTNDIVKHQAEQTKTRAEEVMEVEKQLLDKYKDPNLLCKPVELMKRGGAYYSTAAVGLMQSIYNNTNEIHIVNTQNNGSILDLPSDAAIETNCMVGRNGIVPLTTGMLPLSIKPLITAVKTYEMFASKAAYEGDYKAAYLALLSNPLVRDANLSEAVLKELLETNRSFLTQFY